MFRIMFLVLILTNLFPILWFKPYTWHKQHTYTDGTQNRYETDTEQTEQTQNRHRTDTEQTQNRHRTDTEQIQNRQNRRRTHAEQTQNRRSGVKHVSRTGTEQTFCRPSACA